MRNRKTGVIGISGLAVVLTLALAGGAAAQSASRAPKIPESAARDSAMARVPRGQVRGEELEREGGRLIYSYDIEVPGEAGVQEVNVDAMTGQVVATTHEGPAKEKAEASREKEHRQHPQAAPGREEAEAGEREHAEEGKTSGKDGAPYAQWVVNEVAAKPGDLHDLQIAVPRGSGCEIVAATDAAQVGQDCTDEELQPMNTDKPTVKRVGPSASLYRVTETLHDAQGNFVGTVVMDVAPSARNRKAALAAADGIRRRLESRIPSELELFAKAPDERGS